MITAVLVIVSQSIFQISPEAVKGFKSATSLFEEREYRKAKEQFEIFLNELGDFRGEALFRIAECDYNTGDYREALEKFENIYKDYKTTYLAPEALYGMVLSYISLGDWDSADKTLIELTKEFPGYKNAGKTQLASAIISFKQDEFEDVLKKLEDNDTKEALFYRAKAYFFLDKPIKSLSTFKEITRKYPETPLARYSYYYMGDVLFFTGDFENALYKYSSFLGKYPYSELRDYARYKLSVCYYNLDDFLKAQENLVPLLNSEDKFVAAHGNLLYGESLVRTGKYKKGLKAYTRVISNFPDLKVGILASLRLGQTFLKMGDTAQARIVYQQMASRFNSGEFAGIGDYLAGAQLFEEKAYQDARNYFVRVLKNYSVSTINCPAGAMLLRTYNRMGDYELSTSLGTNLLNEGLCGENSIWKGRAMFYLAEAFYREKEYRKAKEIYRNVSTEFKEPELQAPTLTGTGWCLLHEDRYDMAEKKFNRVISAYRTDTSSFISSLLGEGIVMFNRKEFEKALDYFEAIPQIDPTSKVAAKAYFYSGKCYYSLEYYRQGIDSWEKVLSDYHDTDIAANAAFQIGQTYFQAIEYEQARPYFEIVVKEYPERPVVTRAQLSLGNSYFNSQKYGKAVKAYSKFLKLFPDDSLSPQVEQSLSNAYYMWGQKNPEKRKEFIQKFPGDNRAALTQYNMGVEAYENEDYTEALREFKKVIADFPETEYAPDALVNIMKIHEERKEYEKLVEEAEHFTVYFPESSRIPLALFYRGLGYYYLNKYEEAISSFKEITEEYPESEYAEAAEFNIEKSNERLGRKESTSERGLKTGGEPERTETQSGISGVEKAQEYLEDRSYSKALDIFLKISPSGEEEEAQVFAGRGKALKNLNRTGEAIEEYSKLMNLNLKDNKYQMQGLADLAALYESNENIEKAKKVYKKLLEVTEDASLEETVKKRLDYLENL